MILNYKQKTTKKWYFLSIASSILFFNLSIITIIIIYMFVIIIIMVNIRDGDCNIRRNILRGQSTFIAGFGCSSRSSSSSRTREEGLDRNKPRHHHYQHKKHHHQHNKHHYQHNQHHHHSVENRDHHYHYQHNIISIYVYNYQHYLQPRTQSVMIIIGAIYIFLNITTPSASKNVTDRTTDQQRSWLYEV